MISIAVFSRWRNELGEFVDEVYGGKNELGLAIYGWFSKFIDYLVVVVRELYPFTGKYRSCAISYESL